jgi:hypothetical protein
MYSPLLLPDLSPEQRDRLASMSAQEMRRAASELVEEATKLDAQAAELAAQSRWKRIFAAALEQVATSTSGREDKASRGTDEGERARGVRKTPETLPLSPRLPAGITRADLPQFPLAAGEDPTGRKNLILGAMWVTRRDGMWRPGDMTAELQRSGLDPGVTRQDVLNSMRRMAARDPRRLQKVGDGRGARYAIPEHLVPIDQVAVTNGAAAVAHDI